MHENTYTLSVVVSSTALLIFYATEKPERDSKNRLFNQFIKRLCRIIAKFRTKLDRLLLLDISFLHFRDMHYIQLGLPLFG